MLTLLVIILVILLFVAWARDKAGPPKSQAQQPAPPQVVNQQWMDYIYDYRKNAKSKATRDFVDQMLTELQGQGMPVPTAQSAWHYDESPVVGDGQTAAVVAAQPTTATPVDELEQTWAQQARAEKQQMQLDNTTLLLYFGAFLFVSAVGLFVGFGTSNGFVRLTAVLAVMAVLYWGGLWIYAKKPKLKIAGLTFVGIGLMLAPLAGVAAYSYLLTGDPQLVWLLTSILCVGLYGHALYTLRHPLLEYIFIGTFVSLFESSVAVFNAPVYAYGWALAALGIALQALSYWRKWEFDGDQPSVVSSQLLLPASLLLSVYFVPAHGTLQLAVTSALSAAFYAMSAVRATGDERNLFAGVAHVLILGAVGTAIYDVNQSFMQVGVGLAVTSVAQLAVVLWRPAQSTIAHDVASIMLLSLFGAGLLMADRGTYVFAATLWYAVVSFAVWLKQARSEGFTLGVIALVFAPVMYSYLVMTEPWAVSTLALAELALLYGVTAAIHLLDGVGKRMANWGDAAAAAYAFGLGVTVLLALWAGDWWAVGLAVGAALTTIYLAERHDAEAWSFVGGLVLAAPVLVTYDKPGAFLAAMSISLVWNILLALRYRREANRWLGAVSWFLLPFAVQHVAQFSDDSLFYALAYTGVVAGFVLARAIAMGKLLQSAKVPLISYLQTASLSYVVGYALGTVVAVGSALAASQYVPVYIVGVLILLTFLLAVKIERQPTIMMVVPLLLQIGLWGTYESAAQFGLYVFLSSAFALGGYVVAPYQPGRGSVRPTVRQAFGIASLALAFIAPVAAFAHGATTPMTFSLTLPGVALLYALWRQEQIIREMAGGVILLGCLWLLSALGITETQAYTHLIGMTAVIYAVWRNTLGDKEGRQAYTVTALVITSVPLLIAALGGGGGDLYGWWFLLEQIGIMLVGFALTDKFVIRWGLYASLLAVLYQLRGLGWAALTVLALFIIGLAIFRLQRSETEHTQNDKTDDTHKKAS